MYWNKDVSGPGDSIPVFNINIRCIEIVDRAKQWTQAAEFNINIRCIEILLLCSENPFAGV